MFAWVSYVVLPLKINVKSHVAETAHLLETQKYLKTLLAGRFEIKKLQNTHFNTQKARTILETIFSRLEIQSLLNNRVRYSPRKLAYHMANHNDVFESF